MELNQKERELSIIVAAYNEEDNLEGAVFEIIQVASDTLDKYEIIIVNDGSQDTTGVKADRLAAKYSFISVLNHAFNQGVGSTYLDGLARAKYEYLTLVPGDNAFHISALRNVFQAVGTADLVVSYRNNMAVRKPLRRFLSVACTLSMRLLTGRPIRDAHSLYVYRVDLARQIKVSPGYGYHIESLSKMLLISDSYAEVPARLNPRPDASSGVMKPKVVWLLITTMGRMFLERRVGRKLKVRRRASLPIRASVK